MQILPSTDNSQRALHNKVKTSAFQTFYRIGLLGNVLLARGIRGQNVGCILQKSCKKKFYKKLILRESIHVLKLYMKSNESFACLNKMNLL